MKKNSGSVSFRSSRKGPGDHAARRSSGQKTSGRQSSARERTDRTIHTQKSHTETTIHTDEFPFTDNYRYFREKEQMGSRTANPGNHATEGGYRSTRTSEPGNRASGKNKARRKKRSGCLLPLIIVILIVAFFYGLTCLSLSRISKHKLNKSSITVNNEDRNMKKYQTIALFGVDDQNNVIGDTGSRTDSIIVACINKTTKKVKLMSIYRDTYVSIDGKYDKINAAYSYGGPEQAINTINRNLDLNITDFATVNFKGLADAVDVLGGITLTIQSEKELDNLNDYIGNMNKINGGHSPKFKDVGTYTFDGNQAVAYSRIRYMEGGDHARAGHQRLVVEGILHEAKKQPWKINALINKVLPQCKTSFTTGRLSRMSLGLFLYDIKDSQAYPFDSFDERYNGIYYGFPTTVESNVVKAHEYLYGTKDYEPTDELLKISKKVEDVADMVSPY